MNSSSLLFEEEDFNDLARCVQENPGDGRIARSCATGIVNREIRRRLEAADIVFGNPHKTTAFGNIAFYLLKKGKKPNKHAHSHRAKSLDIEEVT